MYSQNREISVKRRKALFRPTENGWHCDNKTASQRLSPSRHQGIRTFRPDLQTHCGTVCLRHCTTVCDESTALIIDLSRFQVYRTYNYIVVKDCGISVNMSVTLTFIRMKGLCCAICHFVCIVVTA